MLFPRVCCVAVCMVCVLFEEEFELPKRFGFD